MCPPLPELATALVVEDDALVLTACTELLIGLGMRVRSAASCDAALSALASGNVDVVIANVRPPDTTGAELLRAIRERDTDLPVIFISDWPAFGRADGAALGGAVATAADGYRIGRRARRRSCSPLRGDS